MKSMSRLLTTHPTRKNSEAGMVSIMVTMILMIVMSLIVIGFAQISRRDQRESLDQQLTTQAFYAAESGINDATNLIDNALAAGQTVPAKTDCTSGTGAEAAFYGQLPSSTLSAANDVSYSCLMVNATPASLQYSDVNDTSSTIIPLTTSTGATFSTVTFNWQSKDGTSTPLNGCPASISKAFSITSAWSSSGCGYGVLRFDLVPTSGSGLTVNTLENNTMTAFVVPLKSGGTASFVFGGGTSNANDLIGGSCTNTGCTLTISGLNSSQYYARVSSLYKDASLQVTGTTSTGTTVDFSEGQIMIDSTGKAQDELRRIQVRVSLLNTSSTGTTTNTGTSSTNQLSDYALESTDSICKRFGALSGYYQNEISNVTSSNPMCN